MAEHTNDQSEPGAKERAANVAGAARSEARGVASDAREQASTVASEMSHQVRSVVGDAKKAARSQAQGQSDKLAGTLGTWSGELRALADGRPDQAGDLAGYVDDLGRRVSGLAGRIDERGVDGILDDVQRFARRRPGVFLASAAAVGFVAGRFFRGAGEELGELAQAEEEADRARSPRGPEPATLRPSTEPLPAGDASGIAAGATGRNSASPVAGRQR